jgi:hypothetical protein
MLMDDEMIWDAPGDDASLKEKLDFQKKLRARAEKPWATTQEIIPWISGEYRWWHSPYDMPPRPPRKPKGEG